MLIVSDGSIEMEHVNNFFTGRADGRTVSRRDSGGREHVRETKASKP